MNSTQHSTDPSDSSTGKAWRSLASSKTHEAPVPDERKRLDALVILMVCFAVLAMSYMACAPGNRTQSLFSGLQREPVHNGRPLSAWVADLNDPAKQADAIVVLAQMGPRARLAVPALIEDLKSSDKSVRSSAASVLSRIGTDARTAVPALVDALKDSNQDVRLNAAIALHWISSDVKRTAVTALLEVLKDSDPVLRGKAASALGDSGPEAKQAVPGLRKALKDHNEKVREAAAGALKRIEPDGTGSGAL